MENSFYNQLLLNIQKDVSKLQLSDGKFQEEGTLLAEDIALKEILPIYLQYRNIVNRLITCFDRTISTQKREFIKRLLDCCIGRMLEYKREIVKLNCSEYEWPDDILIKMKWTYDDIAISPSSSYVSDRQDQLNDRRKLIDNLIKMAQDQLIEKVESNLSYLLDGSKLSDLKVDQSMAFEKKQIEKIDHLKGGTEQQLNKSKVDKDENISEIKEGEVDDEYEGILSADAIVFKEIKNEDDLNNAAVTIQRYWRGYFARKCFNKRLNKLEEILEMSISSWKDDSIFMEDEDNLQSIRESQKKDLEKTLKIINREKAEINQNKRRILKDDITDEIREWFLLWYNELGHFGIYPSPNEGGSALITSENICTTQEFVIQQQEEKKQKEKNKDNKTENLKKVKKVEKEKKEGWTMPKSKILDALAEVNQEFFGNWSREDYLKDIDQSVDVNLIKEDIYHTLHLEMRKLTDELMKLELSKLNAALKKDHKKDKEKFVIPGLKKGKQKGRKGKGNKKKDVTVSNEELQKAFNELVSAKIIRNYDQVKLNQWIGDTSYRNHEAINNKENYQHRLGDIKHAIIDYCILPLGSKEVHSVAPLVKSVCLVGQPSSGKTFLANAICTEIGALLFDLSPNVLSGQYEGKDNEKSLMNMIKMLAKAYPPAVVLIDDGDKPWWKKLPAAEKPNQPKRLAKFLPKLLKSIKPGDQIIILGLASEPWKANKRFQKIYNKFIILPLTDYNSLYLFYNQILMKYHEVDRNIDISSLAKATIGYPLGVIHEAIENILNINRRMTLEYHPLHVEEILTELMKWESPPQKDIKQFERFESKTRSMRERE